MTLAREEKLGWALIGAMIAVMAAVMGVAMYATHPTKPTVADPGSAEWKGILTDNQTGCQYVVTISGGVTPRMDATGKQMCDESVPIGGDQ